MQLYVAVDDKGRCRGPLSDSPVRWTEEVPSRRIIYSAPAQSQNTYSRNAYSENAKIPSLGTRVPSVCIRGGHKPTLSYICSFLCFHQATNGSFHSGPRRLALKTSKSHFCNLSSHSCVETAGPITTPNPFSYSSFRLSPDSLTPVPYLP
jgi:hypothetical protein